MYSDIIDKPYVGIGLTQSEVTLAIRFQRPTGPVFEVTSAPLPAGTIKSGSLVHEAAFAQTLQGLWQAVASLRLGGVAVVLPEAAVYLVAVSADTHQRGAAEAAIAAAVPFSLLKARVDFRVVAGDGSEAGKTRIVSLLVPRRVIDAYQAVFDRLDIPVGRYDAPTLALHRVWPRPLTGTPLLECAVYDGWFRGALFRGDALVAAFSRRNAVPPGQLLEGTAVFEETAADKTAVSCTVGSDESYELWQEACHGRWPDVAVSATVPVGASSYPLPAAAAIGAAAGLAPRLIQPSEPSIMIYGDRRDEPTAFGHIGAFLTALRSVGWPMFLRGAAVLLAFSAVAFLYWRPDNESIPMPSEVTAAYPHRFSLSTDLITAATGSAAAVRAVAEDKDPGLSHPGEDLWPETVGGRHLYYRAAELEERAIEQLRPQIGTDDFHVESAQLGTIAVAGEDRWKFGYTFVIGSMQAPRSVSTGRTATSAPPETFSVRVSGAAGKRVNIRAGPGTDSPVVGAAGPGDKFSAYGTADGWYEIEVPQRGRGWIFGQFLVVE